MKRLLFVLFAALLAAGGAAAQTIVDLEFVKQAVARGALLWDARDEATFAKGHIPGAVNIGDPTVELRDAQTEDYRPLPELEKILGGAGLDPTREIVVYAQRGAPVAYFAQLTLRYFGARKAYVFHDGMDGWRAAGQPVATQPVKRQPVALKLVPVPGVTVTTKEVLAAVKRPGVQLIDVRTPKEFRGEDIRAIRGGHIPGAINIPFEANWIDPEVRNKLRKGLVKDTAGFSLKPRDELRKLYAALDPDKETIVYCQSGNRAAETAAVLADLGFRNIKVYDSSWLGYASVLTAPAEDETWLNVGALQATVQSLEARIEELERRLAQRRP
ncbi:MAG: sulfurtransferase [Pseudomonadota bacterium]